MMRTNPAHASAIAGAWSFFVVGALVMAKAPVWVPIATLVVGGLVEGVGLAVSTRRAYYRLREAGESAWSSFSMAFDTAVVETRADGATPLLIPFVLGFAMLVLGSVT